MISYRLCQDFDMNNTIRENYPKCIGGMAVCTFYENAWWPLASLSQGNSVAFMALAAVK